MQVFQGFAAARGRLDGCAVALGNFDGVHQGHQALLAAAIARAGRRKVPSVAATFDPHPGRVLAPRSAPRLLTPLTRKLELFEALGLSAVVVQPFDRSYAALPAEEFLARDLFGGLAPRDVIVGPDFAFGRNRGGTVASLGAACAARGVGFQSLEPVLVEGGVVSSSRIRHLLSEGRVEEVARLLGRPYDLVGTVVHGHGRGRGLGFPTLNLRPENEAWPGAGVYAVRAFVEGRVLGGAGSIGENPTFGDGQLTVEVHLLDFEGDLYGARIAVEFLERLRGQQRYASIPELTAQIERDVTASRAVFAAAAPPGPLSPGRSARTPPVA